MYTITRRIPSFQLAFGMEDNELFCAVMWPDSEGDIPFAVSPQIQKNSEGFVLFNAEKTSIIDFSGVNPDSLARLDAAHLVLIRKVGENYQQLEIVPVNRSETITLLAI